MAVYAYPAVFDPEEGGFNVSFPDLEGCYTCEDGIADSLFMADDVLNLWLLDLEEDGKPIPSPSPIGSIQAPAGGFVSLVLADTDDYRRKVYDRFHGMLSLQEAANRWHRADATLRQAILRGKFSEGIDCKHIGKQWVILEEAMRREYGDPEE